MGRPKGSLNKNPSLARRLAEIRAGSSIDTPAGNRVVLTPQTGPVSPYQSTVAAPILPTKTGAPNTWASIGSGPQIDKTPEVVKKILGIGRTGTINYGGYFQEETYYLLKGRNASLMYDEMRRSDYQVSGVLRHIYNKIKGADFYFSVPDEKDTKYEAQSKFLEEVFFNRLNKNWNDTLQDIISFIPFGFSLFEPTWCEDEFDCGDGKKTYWILKSLGYRSQKTIWKWVIVDDKLWSVQQISWGDDAVMVDIPGDDCVVFTLDREGNNYEGISMLRSAYGPWFRKQMKLTMDGIGIERASIGFLKAEVPVGRMGTDEMAQLDAGLAAYSTGQTPYLRYPKGFNVAFEKVDYDSEAIQKSIRMEDAAIAKCMMTEFIELGLTNVGSKAVATPKMEEFTESLRAIAKIVCEGMKPLIKKLIDANFGEQDEYPEMTYSGIDKMASLEMAQQILALFQSTGLDMDDTMKRWIRDTWGFPELQAYEPGEPSVVPVTVKAPNDPRAMPLPGQPAAPAKPAVPPIPHAPPVPSVKLDEGKKKLGGPGSGRHPEGGSAENKKGNMSGGTPGFTNMADFEREKIIENNRKEIIGKEIIGYRYGQAPDNAQSYNSRENKYENGVSMASVGALEESRGFATQNLKQQDVEKYYYKGKISDFGGDNEVLLKNVSSITKNEYKNTLENYKDVSNKLINYKIDLHNDLALSGWSGYKIINKLNEFENLHLFSEKKIITLLSEGKKRKPLTLEEKKAYYKDLDPFFEKQVDKYNKELTNSLKNYVIPEYVKSIVKNGGEVHAAVIPKKSKVKDIIKKLLLPVAAEGNKAALAQIKKLAKKEPVKLAEGDDEDYGDEIDDIADQKSNDYVNLLYAGLLTAALTAYTSGTDITSALNDYADNSNNTKGGMAIADVYADGKRMVFLDYTNDPGVGGYRWVAAWNNTCQECAALDGQVWDDYMQVPDRPVHPNCDCDLEPISQEEFDAE